MGKFRFMKNLTLIFIPDISGFTNFVNNTAIEHSQHIISELLEIIIESNKLGFTISEIEGDAILFYKKDNIPHFEQIFEQTKEMFIRFHSHLKDIEYNNVCQCGACKSASNLSLKFITHVGETQEVNVNKFNKLIGSDLILAHRLLKNSIKSDGYLLLTDSYLAQTIVDKEKLDDWVRISSNIENVDKFGEVSSKYIELTPLLSKIPEFLKSEKVEYLNRKPDIQILINAPILLVHNALIDAEAKYKFVPGIKKVESDSKINRINSSHTCVFDTLEIRFVTKNNTVNKKNISYSEEAELSRGFRFITDYHLQDIDGKTNLSIYLFQPKIIDGKSKSFLQKVKNYFTLKFIILNNKKGIKYFKAYCENIKKENS
jgi:hypothetical protein